MLDTHIRKAIILVGGEGTRLRPLTWTTTKAMMPVLNVPFIERVISYLASYNISEIILAMGYRPDSISEYFTHRNTAGINLFYSVEETALGTAGAVKNTEAYINEGETFLVLNGDIFTDLDLKAMQNYHKSMNAAVTIALTPVKDPSQFGVVERDNTSKITRFIEKPSRNNITSNLINAGIYIMDTRIFAHMPPKKFCMFEKDVFPQLIAGGEAVYGYSSNAYWIDMGTPRKFLDLNLDLLLGKSRIVLPVDGGHAVGEGTEIHSEAQIAEPAIIGAKCNIGRGAVLKGPLVIGTGCTISDYAFINSSIIMDGTSVGKHAKVINSILASGLDIKQGESVENRVMALDPTAGKTVTSQL